MTTLSQKEREDLQDVFTSISEVKPSAFSKMYKLQIIMYFHRIFHLFSSSRKRITYQK
jgi:hypothetical protein